MGGRGPTPAADLGCLSAGPSPYAFGFQETRRPALESPSGAPLACLRKSRQLGLQPPAPAPAEETPSSAGPRRERSSEESISAKAIPVTKNHRRTRHPAQLENQHCHQLVPQLQVRSCSQPSQSQLCRNARPALKKKPAIHCAWEGILGAEDLVFSQLGGFFFVLAF